MAGTWRRLLVNLRRLFSIGDQAADERLRHVANVERDQITFLAVPNARSGSDVIAMPGQAAVWLHERSGVTTRYTGEFAIYGDGGVVLFKLAGYIVESRGLPTDAYLHNPPNWLRNHRHGPCLQLIEPPENLWFKMHFTRPPRTFDEARSHIEMMLAEALLGPR
jgi:hypothetical protein